MLANVLERCARQDTWEALVMLPRGSLKLGKKQHWGAPQAHDPSQKDKVRSIYSIYAPRVSLFRSSIMIKFIGSNNKN